MQTPPYIVFQKTISETFEIVFLFMFQNMTHRYIVLHVNSILIVQTGNTNKPCYWLKWITLHQPSLGIMGRKSRASLKPQTPWSCDGRRVPLGTMVSKLWAPLKPQYLRTVTLEVFQGALNFLPHDAERRQPLRETDFWFLLKQPKSDCIYNFPIFSE